VKLLLKKDADVNAFQRQKKTPLLLAYMSNDVKIVKLLLAAGADVNKPDRDGNTLLILACMSNNVKMVKVLLVAGADVNITDEDGHTPLNLMVKTSNLNLVKILINYYNNYDILKKSFDLALSYCANAIHPSSNIDDICQDDNSGNRKKIFYIVSNKTLRIKPKPLIQSVPKPEATHVMPVVDTVDSDTLDLYRRQFAGKDMHPVVEPIYEVPDNIKTAVGGKTRVKRRMKKKTRAKRRVKKKTRVKTRVKRRAKRKTRVKRRAKRKTRI